MVEAPHHTLETVLAENDFAAELEGSNAMDRYESGTAGGF